MWGDKLKIRYKLYAYCNAQLRLNNDEIESDPPRYCSNQYCSKSLLPERPQDLQQQSQCSWKLHRDQNPPSQKITYKFHLQVCIRSTL